MTDKRNNVSTRGSFIKEFNYDIQFLIVIVGIPSYWISVRLMTSMKLSQTMDLFNFPHFLSCRIEITINSLIQGEEWTVLLR